MKLSSYTFIGYGLLMLLIDVYRYVTSGYKSVIFGIFIGLATFSIVFILIGVGLYKQNKIAKVIAYILSGLLFVSGLFNLVLVSGLSTVSVNTSLLLFEVFRMIPFIVLIFSVITKNKTKLR